MKSNQSTSAADKLTISLPTKRGVWGGWQAYWFTPCSPLGLHVLRVLTGVVLLFWLVTLAGHQGSFFSLQGFADEQLFREASKLGRDNPESLPIPIGWSIFFVAQSPALVNALYWGSLVVLALFTFGIATRLTSILSWLVVVSFTANPAIHYDADALLVLLAYYLMIGYVLYGLFSQRLTPIGYALGSSDTLLFNPLDKAGKKEAAEPTSYAAHLVMRLMQVTFAIVVVTSGLHKLQIGDWWGGIALWFPLHQPFDTTHQDLRQIAPGAESYLFVLSLVQYLMLAWQIGFPLFAWKERGWRVVLLGGAIIGWFGSALLWRQPLFGPVYLVFCLSYLTAEEWRWLAAWLPGKKVAVGKAPAVRPWSTTKESGSVHVKAM